jgi:hypothetical protein
MGFSVDDFLKLAGAGAGAYDAYKGASDQISKPYYVAGQEELLSEGMNLAKQQGLQGPREYYPGQTVAGRDPNVTAGEDSQLSQMGRMTQLGEAAGQAAGTLSGGGADRIKGFEMQDQIGFGIPQEYQNAIMNPIMRNLNERVIPGLHTASTAQGAFGGSRMQQQKADAATQATEAATDAMIRGNLQARQQSIGQRAGDISAQLEGRGQDIRQNQMYNDAMARGVQSTPTAQGALARPGAIQAGIGADRTMYDQALIDADKAGYDWTQAENVDYVDRLLNRAGGYKSGGTVQQGQRGGALDILAGMKAGAQLPGSFNWGSSGSGV